MSDIAIAYDKQNATLSFAADELAHWLGMIPDTGGDGESDGGWRFDFVVDETMTPFSFAVECAGADDGGAPYAVKLSGPDSACVLHAVYTMLEQLGVCFEITGARIPEKGDMARLAGWSQTVTPAVERRGVRQHINFCMDLSAYPLSEAKEYVRNLARLRFNSITFHSYPGHWTRVKSRNAALFRGTWDKALGENAPAREQTMTGAFFYGGHFPVPQLPVVRKAIRFNKDVFCAPEFEEVYYDIPERGERTVHWLAEVMAEAKRVGMTVHLSTELRSSTDFAVNRKTVEDIINDYPMIDVLEFITSEGGRSGGPIDTRSDLVRLFGDGVLDIDGMAALTEEPGSTGLRRQLEEFAAYIKMIDALKQEGWGKKHDVRLATGAYCTAYAPYIDIIAKLAEAYLSEDVTLVLMPGHSSRVVADVFAATDISPRLLGRTILYSWAEFDGSMYLQQHSAEGIYKLIHDARKILGDGPLHGILVNHWRTAEYFASFRYLSEVSLDASITPGAFSRAYGRKLGIRNVDAFADALSEIDELSDQRAIAGNIGFCLGWNAMQYGRPGIGSVRWWSEKNVRDARDRYGAILDNINKAREGIRSESGRELVDLLANRVEASLHHLRMVIELFALNDAVYGAEQMPDPAALPEGTTTTTDGFDRSAAKTPFDFLLQYEGFLRVPATGDYTFHVQADDAAKLYLDGRRVLATSFRSPGTAVEAQAHLEAGLCPLRLDFWQRGGGYWLKVRYEGPGMPEQDMTPAVLFVDEGKPGLIARYRPIDPDWREKPLQWRERITDICNRAEAEALAYLRVAAGNVPDRSAEGLLVSYYWEPVVFINNLRFVWTGAGEMITVTDEAE